MAITGTTNRPEPVRLWGWKLVEPGGFRFFSCFCSNGSSSLLLLLFSFAACCSSSTCSWLWCLLISPSVTELKLKLWMDDRMVGDERRSEDCVLVSFACDFWPSIWKSSNLHRWINKNLLSEFFLLGPPVARDPYEYSSNELGQRH